MFVSAFLFAIGVIIDIALLIKVCALFTAINHEYSLTFLCASPFLMMFTIPWDYALSINIISAIKDSCQLLV